MKSGHVLTAESEPRAGAMRAELERLLVAPGFAQSPVMSRLLRFLVEETIAGRGDALKAYVVAVEGLGRSPEFDPDTDSYPRVQVGRLRRQLTAHYALHPVDNPCLHIPLGAYKVYLAERRVAYPTLIDAEESQVEVEEESPGAVVPEEAGLKRSKKLPALAILFVLAALLLIGATMWRRSAAPAPPPAILSPVLLIHLSGNGEVQRSQSEALTDLAMANLADGLRRSWVVRPIVDGPAARARNTGARYAIEAQAGPASSEDRLHLFVRLLDEPSGAVIWSTDRIVSTQTSAMKADLAGLIAQIGSPFGVVAQAERSRIGFTTQPGYPCLLAYGTYYRTREDALKRKVFRCLQNDGPEPGLVHAIEAARAVMLYATADAPHERAKRLAEAKQVAARAVTRKWDSPDALFSSASLAFYNGECQRAAHFAGRAIRANPYNPNMFGALGVLIYPCDRKASRAYLETARVLEPDGPPNFRVPLLIMAFEGDRTIDVKSLVAELETTAQAGPAYKALGRALVAAGQGDRATARRQWQRVWSLAPTRPASDDELLRSYILSDPLRAIALAQLKKGGALDG